MLMVYRCAIACLAVAALLLFDGGTTTTTVVVAQKKKVKRRWRRRRRTKGGSGDEERRRRLSFDYPGPGFEWRAPRSGVDERGPCPVFNAFANHGMVNRNGIDIPVEELFELTYKFADTHPDFMRPRFEMARGLDMFHFNDDGVEVVSMSDLYSHNAIEHDSSLVRSDDGLGFEKSKDMDADLLLGLLSTNPRSDYVTKGGLWRYQRIRMLDSMRNNPSATYSSVARFSIPAEKLFLIKIGQHKKLRKISKYALLTLLGFERIPTGYVPYHVRFPRRYDPTRFPESAQWKYTFLNGTVELDLLLEYIAGFDDLAPKPLSDPAPCATCN